MVRVGGGPQTVLAGGDSRTSALIGESGRAQPSADVPGWVRWSRVAYLIVAWVFVVCVFVQVLFAGMAIFVDSARWLWHTSFIHAFEGLPLLMMPLVFAARLSVSARWLTGSSSCRSCCNTPRRTSAAPSRRSTRSTRC